VQDSLKLTSVLLTQVEQFYWRKSTTTLNIGGTECGTHQWRLIREAEDPSNSDITAAYCSVIVVQNQSDR
jgi:hypothetical protein